MKFNPFESWSEQQARESLKRLTNKIDFFAKTHLELKPPTVLSEKNLSYEKLLAACFMPWEDENGLETACFYDMAKKEEQIDDPILVYYPILAYTLYRLSQTGQRLSVTWNTELDVRMSARTNTNKLQPGDDLFFTWCKNNQYYFDPADLISDLEIPPVNPIHPVHRSFLSELAVLKQNIKSGKLNNAYVEVQNNLLKLIYLEPHDPESSVEHEIETLDNAYQIVTILREISENQNLDKIASLFNNLQKSCLAFEDGIKDSYDYTHRGRFALYAFTALGALLVVLALTLISLSILHLPIIGLTTSIFVSCGLLLTVIAGWKLSSYSYSELKNASFVPDIRDIAKEASIRFFKSESPEQQSSTPLQAELPSQTS